MSWATRIALPIVAIGGLVYVVTWISNSTSAPRKVDTSSSAIPRAVSPLEFLHRVAQTDFDSPYLKYFRSNYEVGEPGKVDFWFKYNGDERVDVMLLKANCTCSGALIATVPPEAFDKLTSWLGAASLTPESLAFAPMAFLAFQESLEFRPLVKDGSISIQPPPSKEGVARYGILRVTWNGQTAEQAKTLIADIQTRLANQNPETIPLEVRLLIVPPFRLFVAGSATGEIPLGDILPFGTNQQEIFAWSTTREEIEATPSLLNANSCFEVDRGVQLSGPEFAAASQKIMKSLEFPMTPKGILKFTLTVRERTKDAQLDMGPLNQFLEVKSHIGSKARLPLSGTVRGEIRVVGETQETDRINFGATFRTEAGATRKVRILSDKEGIALKLIPEAFLPTWMTAKLTPDKDPDAKGAWVLEVTIPPGKLSGKITSEAAVVLEVDDGTKRRIRIPVVATAYGETGKPVF